MASGIPGRQQRRLLLGERVSKATGVLAAVTQDLFVVAGGECLITSLYGLVTTSITVANTYYLKAAPTAGDASQLCVSTDIGTTDTVAGGILGFGLGSTTAPPKLMSPSGSSNVSWGSAFPHTTVTTGKLQGVGTGTDGAITWVLTYVPLTDGATILAA